MNRFLSLIPRLREAGVDFVVIGGVAAIAHGSARITTDLDIASSMDFPNLQNVIRALADLNPKHRWRQDLGVITPDDTNLRGLRNLYLSTDWGILDILGEVSGVGMFSDVLALADELDLGEYGRCKVINLDGLIAAKTAAGRPKDKLTVIELETIRTRRKNAGVDK
jgi:hypothetical protein